MNELFVVLEWNQVSGQPRIAFNGDLYDKEVDAIEDAAGLLSDLRANGRREHVGVAKVVVEEVFAS